MVAGHSDASRHSRHAGRPRYLAWPAPARDATRADRPRSRRGGIDECQGTRSADRRLAPMAARKRLPGRLDRVRVDPYALTWRSKESMQQRTAIQTELGLLRGRDCIYLDKVSITDRTRTLLLEGEVNGNSVGISAKDT